MSATQIKIGDRVRTKGAPTYPDGTEFTVTKVEETDSYRGGWVGGDWRGYGVWVDRLELIPTGYQDSPHGESKRSAHIRQIEDLQRTIRRRNEQISELLTKTRELCRVVELLEQVGLTDALEVAADRVYDVNVANGWFEEDRTVGDDIALIHSEASEMLEAYRDGGLEDQTATEPLNAPHKPEGYGAEAADVLIRLLDTCKRRGVNLGWEFERKLVYNKSRGHRHGGKLL